MAHADSHGDDADAPANLLAERLHALASPTRLALLGALRTPRLASEIDLPGPRGGRMSRQAVQEQLDRLVDAGIVHCFEVPIQGRRRRRYEADAHRVFAASEALRNLGGRMPLQQPDTTLTAVMGAPAKASSGPRLLLVHGVDEGAVYPLVRRKATQEGWLIGRDPSCAVPLVDDGAVSRVHARITRDFTGRHHLHVAPTAKNPVQVDWAVVDDSTRLHAGSIVSVGHSKLVFRDG